MTVSPLLQKKERKKKVQLASASSYHPIIFFPYHQPFLKEWATHIVSTATLSKSSMPSVFFLPHHSAETSCTLKGYQAGTFVVRETLYTEEVKLSLTVLCNNSSMLDLGYFILRRMLKNKRFRRIITSTWRGMIEREDSITWEDENVYKDGLKAYDYNWTLWDVINGKRMPAGRSRILWTASPWEDKRHNSGQHKEVLWRCCC